MISSEHCLLGIILNNSDLFTRIHRNIFLDTKCKELYKLIQIEHKRSKGFTKEAIIELVKSNAMLNENEFYEIYDSAYDEQKFDQYYNFVMNKWALHKLEVSTKDLRSKSYTSVVDLKNEIQNIIADISIDDEKEIRSSKDIIYDIISDLDKNEKPKLINSHCSYIDSYGGFEPGDFVIIAARPGCGKSSLMYNLILKDMYNNTRCGLFSLEASERKIYRIIGCLGAGVDTRHLRTNSLTNQDKEKLSNTYERIYDKEILTVDRVNVSIETLRRKVKIMKDEKDIKKVYVDYFQLLTGRGNTRYEQMSNISRELKKIAMDMDIVVVSLAQLNREVENRAEGRPRKSDLRDTGSLEQDADIIWLLYNFNKENGDEVVLGNIIDKFREGAEGEFKSTFQKPTRRIKEWGS